MITTLKSTLHKFVGLYIIWAFTTVGLVSDTFAQFGVNPENTQGIDGIGGTGTDAGDNIMDVIKNFINWALSLLGLIALIMLLFGGYKMVVSGGDEEAYKEGLKILKNAAIGLAFIAVSWFLVTFIFWVLGAVVN